MLTFFQEKKNNLKINIYEDKTYMHEGFHCDDPNKFTRDWFAWSNSLFSHFIYHKLLKK
nr:glycoside hydrolase family 125 protein [Clostridium massiliamazoniense]